METKTLGIDPQGREAVLLTIRNRNGMSVVLSNFGARLISIFCPDRDGKLTDVCLGFDTLEDYRTRSGYLGATVGRWGNRIANSSFELGGVKYNLFPNNGKNSLHGGKEGFDKKFWAYSQPGPDKLVFEYVSPDGEEGYPGELRTTVTFTLSDEGGLAIDYEARSDKDTVVNLTNHAYFNLGGEGTIKDHLLQIHAQAITGTTPDLIPTGELNPVEGTPYDVRSEKRIGDCLDMKGNAMFDGAKGFDMNYVLDGSGLREAAILYDPLTGRQMRVLTDQPGIQIYSGQGLKGSAKNGAMLEPFSGIAMETQHFPDSVHQPHFPSTVLKAGEVYRTTTIYEFTLRG